MLRDSQSAPNPPSVAAGRPEPPDSSTLAADIAAPLVDDVLTVEGPTTRWIVRNRWVIAVLVAGLWLLSFNGQWRIGQDSAIYRGVARNIIEGHGYTLNDRAHDLAYPGLPLLLAGTAVLFGEHPLPAVLIVFACGLGCLPVIYRLVRMQYPAWVAWTVMLGSALNASLLQYSNEILTDVPFLLGLLVALLGWERLLTGHALRRGAIELVLGLALAASMRPTFWVLAVAFILTAAWKMTTARRRKAWSIGLCVVVGVAAVFIALDPRTWNTVDGTYGGEFLNHLRNAPASMQHNLPTVFGRHINFAFFSQTMSPGGWIWTVLLLIGMAMLLRRQVLWAMTAFVLVVVTLLFADEPRYFLMILPMLWLAWLLLTCRVGAIVHGINTDRLLVPIFGNLTRRFPPKDLLIALSLSLVVLANLGGHLKLLTEQRSVDFLQTYRDGEYVPLIAMSRLIADATPPDALVIGPQGAVLSYISRRNVMGDPLLLRGRPVSKWDKLLAEAKPDFVVMPRRWYQDRDFRLYDLLDRNVLMSDDLIGEVPGPISLYLGHAKVVLTEGDWRDRKTTSERRR